MRFHSNLKIKPYLTNDLIDMLFTLLQIDTLNSNIATAANLLGRCSSCMKNFVRNICDFTCRPDQNRFMKPTEVMVSPRTSKWDRRFSLQAADSHIKIPLP